MKSLTLYAIDLIVFRAASLATPAPSGRTLAA
jgi:hypothetical protein